MNSSLWGFDIGRRWLLLTFPLDLDLRRSVSFASHGRSVSCGLSFQYSSLIRSLSFGPEPVSRCMFRFIRTSLRNCPATLLVTTQRLRLIIALPAAAPVSKRLLTSALTRLRLRTAKHHPVSPSSTASLLDYRVFDHCLIAGSLVRSVHQLRLQRLSAFATLRRSGLALLTCLCVLFRFTLLAVHTAGLSTLGVGTHTQNSNVIERPDNTYANLVPSVPD